MDARLSHEALFDQVKAGIVTLLTDQRVPPVQRSVELHELRHYLDKLSVMPDAWGYPLGEKGEEESED